MVMYHFIITHTNNKIIWTFFFYVNVENVSVPTSEREWNLLQNMFRVYSAFYFLEK